ncbi:MAG: HAD domain-containing protein [Bacteroidota bacterium]|nr:HAD domain-containing protein [Bacteroidota bacterium]
MKILLDIDGVMVTTPAWKKAEIHEDGFLMFNSTAADNLSRLIAETNASIILTTTHRISFSDNDWQQILERRGIKVSNVSKINNCSTIQEMPDRATEIKQWVDNKMDNEPFVIIDDDSSLNGLPLNIKAKWVKTSSLIGFDKESADTAKLILCGHNNC